MAEVKKQKARIELIDIAKGLTIFMVVWGHTATNDVLTSPSVPTLYKIFYSIHMPLFFFLSGMSMSTKPMRTKDDWRAFIKKDILTIAFPYFIWALIYGAFSMKNVGWIFYGSWQALTNAASLTSLWYLSCLFVARIMVAGIITIVTTNTKWKLEWAAVIIGVVSLIIGLILPKLKIGYPWCFDVAFVASACILFGLALKRPMLAFSVQKLWVLITAFLVCVGIYVAAVILRGENFEIMMMCKSSYGEGIGALICAVFGGMAVMLLAMLMMRFAEAHLKQGAKRAFLYIGQYTMGIFLLHKPMMQQAIIPLLTKLLGKVFSLGLINFISAIVAIIISHALCNVIYHYVPELIGVFSKDKLVPRVSGDGSN